MKPEQLQSVRATLRSPRRLKTEALAGLVVALALIPEAIAFSVIAGVDPRIGLFASFTMAVTISFVGGRPAMISAATGAVALVIAPLMRSHGLDHLIAAVILAGVFQILLAVLGVTRLMRFIPRSVMVGFVNALAILVFMAQLPELIGVPWPVYPLVAAGLLIVVGFRRITTAVPSPLVAIVLLTVLAVVAGIDVPTVQDKGQLPESLPTLFIPNVPLTWETFQTIAPFSLSMALVGLLESLMTSKLVDDITDTRSNKTRESWGQGVANIITGLPGRHGRLRRDRADHDQRQGLRRAEPGVHVPRGRLPAGAGGHPGRHRGPHPHGRPRGGDDLRLGHHVRLALGCARNPEADAQSRKPPSC